MTSLVTTKKWSRLNAAMRDEIVGALADNRGRVLPTSKLLGLSRATVYHAIKRFGITKAECLREREKADTTYVRFKDIECIIKEQLISARKSHHDATAKLLSELKAELKKMRVWQCAEPSCATWLKRGKRHCFLHDKEGRSLFKTNL